jgi:hypothetical protein
LNSSEIHEIQWRLLQRRPDSVTELIVLCFLHSTIRVVQILQHRDRGVQWVRLVRLIVDVRAENASDPIGSEFSEDGYLCSSVWAR